jgi:hypothetical protein
MTPGICRIPLTRGLFAVVEPRDFEVLRQHRWFAHASVPGRFYAARRVTRTIGGVRKRTTIFMHRVIARARPGEDVDHKNGDTLLNVRRNLRRCTRSANLLNSTAAASRGVFLCRQTGLWFARISDNGRRIFLGRFPNRRAAISAMRAARRERGQYQSRERFGREVC